MNVPEAISLQRRRRVRNRRGGIAFSLAATFLLLTTICSDTVRAHDPFGDVNLALATYGSVASASGSASGYGPANANDGSFFSSWKCNRATPSQCWIQVRFPGFEDFDEVNLHMPANGIASAVNIFADKNGDGNYPPGELVYQMTGNAVEDVVIPLPFTNALGVRVKFVAMKPGAGNPAMKELEVYLRDSDQDGLFNGFEMQKRYTQNASYPDPPLALADEDVTTGAVRLLPWDGVLVTAQANLTVEHDDVAELTVQVGYYDAERERWFDRYVWNPGDQAPLPEFSLEPAGPACCLTKVTAVITNGIRAAEARFFVDGVLRRTLGDFRSPLQIMFPRWEWTWDTGAETETDHLVEVVLLDRDGNAVLGSSTIRVDNTLPVASVLSPEDQQVVSGVVEVNATATDDYLLQKVEFLVDNVVRETMSSPTVGSSFLWSWDTLPYADGSHTLGARAVDAAGNVEVHAITVTIENPPNVAIVSPAADAFVAGATTVTAFADDPSGIEKVDFYVDNLFQYTDTTPVGNNYEWSWDTSEWSEGFHQVKAVATDNYGLQQSHEIPVTVDNVAPGVAILSPGEGATVGGWNVTTATIVVRANVDEANVASVEFRVDGSLAIAADPVSGSEYHFGWDTYGVESEGNHTLAVRAYDQVGSMAEAQVTVTLDNHYLPTVSIVYPMEGSTVSGTVPILVSASDDEMLSYVEVKAAGMKSRKYGEPFQFDWATAKLADGWYTIEAKAYEMWAFFSTASVTVCVNSCLPGGESGWGLGGGEVSGDGGSAALFGLDPLTGEVELPVDEDGVTGTHDLADAANYTWTSRTVALLDDEPETGRWVDGDNHAITVDIVKHVRDLTTQEIMDGFLAPNFEEADFAAHGKWRVSVRDWVAGTSGTLRFFTLSLVERTDPLIADTDGDGVADGDEVMVQDLDGDGWKELHEVTEVKALPVAVDSEGDGLDDYRELQVYDTDPLIADTDGDDLSDFDEVEQYYVESKKDVSATIYNEGTLDVPFVLEESGFYMYKFLMTVTFEREESGWVAEDATEWGWLPKQDDAAFAVRLVFKKDGAVVDSGSRGSLIGVNSTPPMFVLEESRFLVSVNGDVADQAGSHTATLELLPGPMNEVVTLHVYRFEVHRRATDPTMRDTDWDGLGDGDEADLNAKPWDSDTDGDGLVDGWQDTNGDGTWQPNEPIGEVGDAAQDGAGGWGTSPTDVDTDGDGLRDGFSMFPYVSELGWGTLPTTNDTDGDGLLDGWDDVDEDGFWDYGETKGEVCDGYGGGCHHTYPHLRDSDGDTMHDGWEVSMGYNPLVDDSGRHNDADPWTAAYEFLLGTDPYDEDTDDDGLWDSYLEVPSVLLRTSVEEGAVNSSNYAHPGDWVAYVGVRYDYVSTVTNDTADAPANTSGSQTVLITILPDGAGFYENTTVQEIYLWMPGADTDDTEFNGSGNGYLNGTYHAFSRTGIPANMEPLPGYRHREVYRGSSPLDNDTDEDGILDGDEVDFQLDADGDGWRNNADPDADGDGIWDGDEIDWALDSDLDGAENMVDPDSDHPMNLGTPDGLEPLWNEDMDGDGLINAHDPDNDGDNLPDEFEDGDRDGVLDAGESDMNLADSDGDGLWDGWRDVSSPGTFEEWLEVGEDVNADSVVDLLETDPRSSDTDGDGLGDGVERRPGDFWREAESYTSEYVTVHEDPAAVGGKATYRTGAPGPVYEGWLALSSVPARYRLLIRARQSDPASVGLAFVILDGYPASDWITVNTTEYAWFSSPALEAELANSVVPRVSTNELGTFYLDRLLLVRVDRYQSGRHCGQSSIVAFDFSDVAGGNGTFCYEVPASSYARELAFDVTGSSLPRVNDVSDMGTPRADHAVAQINGLVFALAGRNSIGSDTNSMERYDPAKDAWEVRSVPSTGFAARHDHAIATSHGELIVVGGDPTWREVWRYDPAANEGEGDWFSMQDLPYSRSRHCAVAANGRVYVIGGRGEGPPNYQNTVGEIDVRRATQFAERASMNEGRVDHACVVLGEYVYAIGGANSAGPLASVERWKPSDPSAVWSSVPPLQTARGSHAAAVIDGRIWVFGGANLAGSLSSVEIYDPAGNAWSYSDEPLPYERFDLAAAEVNGTAYLTGGRVTTAPMPTVQSYNVSYPSRVSIDLGADGRVDWRSGAEVRGELSVPHLGGPLASYARSSPDASSGKLLIVGGAGGVGTSTLGGYASLSIWESLPDVPVPTSMASAAVWDGVLYVVADGTTTVRALSPSTLTWTTLAPMPVALSRSVAVAVDGRLYVIGGASGGTSVSWVFRYDIADGTWSQLDDMPDAVQEHAAVAVGRDIYTIGGVHREGSTVSYRADVRVFHTNNATWSLAATLWEARAGLKAIVVDGSIYAFGGQREAGYSAKLEALYEGATSWVNLSAMPTAKAFFSAGVSGSTVFAVGGRNAQTLAEVAAYDILTDSWSTRGALPAPRADAADATAPGLVPVLVSVRSATAGSLSIMLNPPSAWPLATDPSQGDSDGDTLGDGDETLVHRTLPLSVDSDLDRLPDHQELAFGTRPDLHDTDGDGLWDGYYDADWDGAFDLLVELGEDTDLDGVRDDEETDPTIPDVDGDGLLDGEEWVPGFAWFEAEFHLLDGASRYDEDSDGVNDATDGAQVSATAPGTGQYRFSVLAKGSGSTAQSLTFSWQVGGVTVGQSTVPLYFETVDGAKQWSYRWFSTSYFTANAGQTVAVTVPDGGAPASWLRVDRILLVRADEVAVSAVSPNPILFDTHRGTSLLKTTYVTLPAISDGVPRFVSKVSFDISPMWWVDDTPPYLEIYPYPLLAIIGDRRMCFQPDWSDTGYPEMLGWIDYAGEFNAFLKSARWDGSSAILVPLRIAAFSDCAGDEDAIDQVIFNVVSVVLEPVGSSPLAADTDLEGLRDGDEWSNGTSPLSANSDRDQRKSGSEFWDCTDLRETRKEDTTCEGANPDLKRGTDPMSMDTEGDAWPDGPDPDPWTNDMDGDGIIDAAEKRFGTDPTNPDTDWDGLLDGANVTLASGPRRDEWAQRGIMHQVLQDGSYQFWGERGWGSDPKDADTDGDWLEDGDEAGYGTIGRGTDPLRQDSDRDGFPDGWEVKFNGRGGIAFDPKVPADPHLDTDEDGLTNLDEYELGTIWCRERDIRDWSCEYDVNEDGDNDDYILNRADDDDDTIPTEDELFYGSDPYVADIETDLDGDGLTNTFEYFASPRLDYGEPDTEGDGWEDGAEMAYWDDPAHPCPPSVGGSLDCATTYDVDGDGVADGDEVDGWYVWILIDPEAGEWFEFHVASDPNDVDTDDDGVPDGTEYLRSDPTTDDTDGDGLTDWYPTSVARDVPPPGFDTNPVEPEDIPPKLSDIRQNARLEWAGIVVAHTWLDLEVTATDNAGIAGVAFRFVDTNTTREALVKGGDRYATTFEIDFWADYMWGYEVEAYAFDFAGNTARKIVGGGLTYAIGKLVAGFLSFLLGPAIGGAVFGFFLGMAVGLFEDLSIFLHIHEIFGAILQLPGLIANLVTNTTMLQELFVGMIAGHLTRCNMVSPYPSAGNPDDMDWWNARIVKLFHGEADPEASADAVVFGVSCTLASIVGYIVQQFLIGTGIAKFAGKLNEVAGLTKKLSDGLTTLRRTVGSAARTAAATAKGVMRGAAEALTGAFAKIGKEVSESVVSGFRRLGIRLGCFGACETWLGAFFRLHADDAAGILAIVNRMPEGLAAKMTGLMRRANHWFVPFRLGAKAEIDRILHYFDSGMLDDIQVNILRDGRWIRPDAKLVGGKFLEVKRWSERWLSHSMDRLVQQLKNYVGAVDEFPNGGVLELIGHYGDDVVESLCNRLPTGVTLKLVDPDIMGAGTLGC